jgi:hypothetical protein
MRQKINVFKRRKFLDIFETTTFVVIMFTRREKYYPNILINLVPCVNSWTQNEPNWKLYEAIKDIFKMGGLDE